MVGRIAAALAIIVLLLLLIVMIAATREKVSARGWVVAHVIAPALFGQSSYDPQKMRQKIADNRRIGPALPDKSMRSRYRYDEQKINGVRVLRLGPKGRTSSRIVFLHGGGYVFDLDPSHWTYAASLVDQTGAEILVPLYPLAPEHHAEAGLAAVEATYLEAVREVGTGRVALTGDSAGGGLALALTQSLHAAGKARPASLVLFYPWLDATVSGADQPSLQRRDHFLQIAELRAWGRLWSGQVSPSSPRVSPLFGDLSDLPPTLVLSGTRDVLLSDTRRLKDRAPSVEVDEVPGMFHAFLAAPVPERDEAVAKASAFINSHFVGR